MERNYLKMIKASRDNDLDEFKKILSNPNVYPLNREYCELIMGYCCMDGRIKMVKLLLDDDRSSVSRYDFRTAVEKEFYDIADLLIKYDDVINNMDEIIAYFEKYDAETKLVYVKDKIREMRLNKLFDGK